MHKIRLIIKREYLTRIRKKTFILSTILFPLVYILLIFGSGYLAAKGGKKLQVALVDSSGMFTTDRIAADSVNDPGHSSVITVLNQHPDSVKAQLEASGYDGLVVIPAKAQWNKPLPVIPMFTARTLSIEGAQPVQDKLNRIWSHVKNDSLGLDSAKIAILQENTVSLMPHNMKDERANSAIASVIGMVSAFMIYIILILYGSQVMMGVMEEKTNRIAEVVVSSVKPFQLMMGKIIGIGLVCLTQILLWITFILIIYNVSTATSHSDSMSQFVGKVQDVFSATNMPLILSCFIFYLLSGFFFYAAIFAAVGSAVNEDMREAQSLTLPLMMPIIFAMAMMPVVLKDPTGPVAFWGSMIPFTSPIVMMSRLPFGMPGTVPVWQLGLSMAILIGGFLFTSWFAGKIYRTGILMYGKKPSWKEMIRWAFRKN